MQMRSDVLMPSSKKKLKRAFTLAEILTVCAIIVVLAAVVLPVLMNAKKSSYVTQCTSNLHQLVVSTQLYVNDNDARLPIISPRSGLITDSRGPRGVTPEPLQKYGATADLYKCAALHPTPPLDYAGLSPYIFRIVFELSALNNNFEANYAYPPAAGSVIAWDWNHGSANYSTGPSDKWLVARFDGSVKYTPYAQIRKSYFVNGHWTFVTQTDGNAFYQFVFPGEPWPPDLTRIQ